LAPGVPIIGILLNPSFAPYQLLQIEEAARSIDQRIVVLKASTDEELGAAFAALTAARVGALLAAVERYFDMRRNRLVVFANRQLAGAALRSNFFPHAGAMNCWTKV
jgi:hypothetical protein